MSLTQEQYDAAKAVLEAELAESVDTREEERIKKALEDIEALVITDATE